MKNEVEEHTKKTFLEELNSKISPNAKSLDFKVKETATEVCKKILDEIVKYNDCTIFYSVRNIICDLGINVD